MCTLGVDDRIFEHPDESGREDRVQAGVDLVDEEDVPFLKHAQHKSHETKPRTRPIALLVDRKRSRFSRVIVDEQRALLYSLAEFFFRDIGESLPDERDEFFLEAVDFSFGKDDVCDAQVSDSYEPADVLCPFAPGVLDQRLGEAEPDAFIEGICVAKRM